MAEDRTPQTPRPRKATVPGDKATPGGKATPGAGDAAKKAAPKKAAAAKQAPPPVLFQPPAVADEPAPARRRPRETQAAETPKKAAAPKQAETPMQAEASMQPEASKQTEAPRQAEPVGRASRAAPAKKAAPAKRAKATTVEPQQPAEQTTPAEADARTATTSTTAPAPAVQEPAHEPTPEPTREPAPARKARAPRKAVGTVAEAPVKRAPAPRTAEKTAVPEARTTEAPLPDEKRDERRDEKPEEKPDATAAPPERTEGHKEPVKEPLTAREPQLTAPRRPGWWGRVPTNPGYAPELLALAAVDSIGPRAAAWAAEIRATYPAATDDGIARLAVRRFTRTAAAGGALASFTGPAAPATEVAALAWTQAGIVLHLAAAYGASPTDRERAVDLLVLTRVHPTPELARAALDSAGAEADDAPHSLQRATEAAWRLTAPLASQTAGWLAVRVLARLVPRVRPLVASAADAAGAERLAHRAIAHYRALAGRPITTG